MSAHEIVIIERIMYIRELPCKDVWSVTIDGIPVTVTYTVRMRHQPKPMPDFRSGIEYKHTVAILKCNNKSIIKHPDYKTIRCQIIQGIIDVYEGRTRECATKLLKNS